VTRLIAVLRNPLGIFALVSERTEPFDASDEFSTNPYRETVMPLAKISEGLCPWRDKDLAAWRALERVPKLGRRAALAVVRAVIGAAVDPAIVVGELAPLNFSAGSVDLRPYMCEPEAEQAVLDMFKVVLADVSRDAAFPDWHWNQRRAIAVLPAQFRRAFLWGLHTSQWPQLELTAAVYEALALDEHHELRRAVSRLFAFAERDHGIEWGRLLVEVEPRVRLRACELVIESGAFGAAPDDGARRSLHELKYAAAHGV